MRLLFLLLAICILNSCSTKEPLYNTQTYVFGTLVDISIYGETDTHAQTVANEIIRRYTHLHQRLHAWQKSELNTINQAFAAGKSITAKPDIVNIVADITALSQQSGGTFNPAIGQLIQLWGFQSDTFAPRHIDPKSINTLLAHKPSMANIQINGNQLHSTNLAVKLDFGGYAKGYALDIGLAYLREQHIQHALINIGGNIIALGQHGAHPWRVGIQHPRQPNAIATVTLPSGWAIGTSGDYQRYFELDGKRYCHLIDPNTGYPVQDMQSVTVLIPPQSNAGVLSDVTSKPIFIAPANERIAAAKTMGVQHVLMIDASNRIQVSAAMQPRLNWLDAAIEQSVEVVQID